MPGQGGGLARCPAGAVARLLVLVSVLTYTVHGGYELGEGRLTFCQSVTHCQSLGGSLATVSNLSSLQTFLALGNLTGVWVLHDSLSKEHAVAEAGGYCNTTSHPAVCPGQVALPAAVGVLRPPLVDCSLSSVDGAVCGSRSLGTVIWNWVAMFFYESEDSTHVKGSFCNVADTCLKNSQKLMPSDDMAGIRRVLDFQERSGAWAAASDDWEQYCEAGPREALKPCPGEIVLVRDRTVVRGTLIGCNLTLPVVCDIPDIQQGRPDDQENDVARRRPMGLIFGILAALLVLLAAVVAAVWLIVRAKRTTEISSLQLVDTNMSNSHKSRQGKETYDDTEDMSDHTYDVIDDNAYPGSDQMSGTSGASYTEIGTLSGHITGHSQNDKASPVYNRGSDGNETMRVGWCKMPSPSEAHVTPGHVTTPDSSPATRDVATSPINPPIGMWTRSRDDNVPEDVTLVENIVYD